MSLPERVATDPTAYARPGKIRWRVFILRMSPSVFGRRLAAQGQRAATPDRTQRPGQMETRRQSYMQRFIERFFDLFAARNGVFPFDFVAVHGLRPAAGR